MLGELAIRFLAGGTAVSAFALLGEKLKPKSFAGIFAAAPSVAIASLTLAAWKEPRSTLATSARSMVVGGVALLACAVLCTLLLRRTQLAVRATTLLGWLAWAAVSGVLYVGWLR